MNEWVWSNGGMILTGETEVLGEKHYTAWVVDKWMSTEQWWNDTDRGNLKYWERNLSQLQFVNLKCILDCPEMDPRFTCRKISNKQRTIKACHIIYLRNVDNKTHARYVGELIRSMSTLTYINSWLPRGLRRVFAAARLLWLRVWISPLALLFDSCDYCVLSGWVLWYRLITRLEDSYRL